MGRGVRSVFEAGGLQPVGWTEPPVGREGPLSASSILQLYLNL